MSVSSRFNKFLASLQQTELQLATGRSRREDVVRALNQHYYNSTHATANSFFIGSWGKNTKIRPPRDVDVFYHLPQTVYDRYKWRMGNVQSQILQEVKGVIEAKFSKTAVKGSGPIVEVGFANYNVEIAPGFARGNQYIVCSTKDGGVYKTADYSAEASRIAESNKLTNGNTLDLIRMMKRWQEHCNVPMRSFWIELLAVSFLNEWKHRGQSATYYDWMCRDFFAFLISKSNDILFAPGTLELVFLGSEWVTRAQTAYGRAVNACNDEEKYPHLAGQEWQKIFGTDIPMGG